MDVGVDDVTPEGQRGQDRRLGGGIMPFHIGRGIALGQPETLRFGRAASSKSTPSSSMRVKMKFVVPLTIPITRRIRSPASDSRNGRMTGMAPATAASYRRSTPCAAAQSASSAPDAAKTRLVGGDDRLARPQGRLDQLMRGVKPADQLDHDVHVRANRQRRAVGPEQRRPEWSAAVHG